MRFLTSLLKNLSFVFLLAFTFLSVSDMSELSESANTPNTPAPQAKIDNSKKVFLKQIRKIASQSQVQSLAPTQVPTQAPANPAQNKPLNNSKEGISSNSAENKLLNNSKEGISSNPAQNKPLNNSKEGISSKFNIPIHKYTLPNGLRVLLNPDPYTSVISYHLCVDVGARHERPGVIGMSHLFEHLMFKGTPKYKSFSDFQNSQGAISNAFTSNDRTCYISIFPPSKLELILEAEVDRMQNLILTQKKLDIEKGIVQEERRLRFENSPRGSLQLEFIQFLYDKHPYRQTVIGSKKDIAGYTLEDLKYWYKTYYSPNNSVLVLSGNFSLDNAKALTEKHFSSWPSQNIPKEEVIKEPLQTQAKNKVIQRDVQSLTATMGFKIGPSSTKDYLALDIISSVLGLGQSSRLYKSIVRDSRLASSISSGTQGFVQESLFYIDFAPINKKSEAQVLQKIEEELEKLRNYPISQRELQKIKNIIIVTLITAYKNNFLRARALAKHEIYYQDYKQVYTRIDDLNKLTPQFIQEVAKKYLNPTQKTYILMEPKSKKTKTKEI